MRIRIPTLWPALKPGPRLHVRPQRTLTRRSLSVGLVLATAGAAMLAGAAASSAATGIETNYQNPVSAMQPISRPDTPHCTVDAMQHDFANSYGAPFVGTLTPPSACPGPWSKAVLDWTGSVAGVQYDRLAGVWIGGAEVLRTSTPEPDPAGISWHVDADISPFIPLLRTPQPLVVDLGNIVNSQYTGIYHITLTVTYYGADRANPPAATADDVVPLSQSTTSAGWWSLTAGQSASESVTFPRNLTGVDLEVLARGGGCEEFWYTNVPNSYNAQHPSYNLCGGGPYREVQVEVDGKLAGVAQPFPAIYSGGINPMMWRPIMSVDSLRTQAYSIDLTPFAGLLTDGKPHTITLLPPSGITDVWTIDGSLFLTTDHGAAQTGGGLLTDTIAAAPELTSTVASPNSTTDVITTTASRQYTVSGYVDTPHGRITTTVTQHTNYSNVDTVTQAGDAQTVDQKDQGYTEIDTVGGGGGRGGGPSATRQTWSYPIDVTSLYQPDTTGSGFLLKGSADVARYTSTETAAGRGWKQTASLADHVTGSGILQIADGGATLQADGQDSEDYQAASPGSPCYHHYIAADHGYVTKDQQLRC